MRIDHAAEPVWLIVGGLERRVCARPGCGRLVDATGGHKRGRPGPADARDAVAQRRMVAATLSFDELLAMGLCECGVWLDEHEPLVRPRKLSSWQSERESLSIWARNRHLTMTEAQAAYHRRQRGFAPINAIRPSIHPNAGDHPWGPARNRKEAAS